MQNRIKVFIVFFLLGCTPLQDDLLAHWQCTDGTYQRAREGCYVNTCKKDSDCRVEFYDGFCGKEQSVFPLGVKPPRYEPKRCRGDICSAAFIECLPPKVHVLLPRCTGGKCVGVEKERKHVDIAGKTFSVAVAETKEERERGLMHISTMAQNEGMLFVFEKPGKHAFWMKNTWIPLDIIFLDDQKKVVSVSHAQPCMQEPCRTYAPSRDASFVLEVKQGVLDAKEGDEPIVS